MLAATVLFNDITATTTLPVTNIFWEFLSHDIREKATNYLFI